MMKSVIASALALVAISQPLFAADNIADLEKAARGAPVPPQTLVIKGEGHSFSKPESAQAWFEALDAFLTRHNPADPPRAVAGE